MLNGMGPLGLKRLPPATVKKWEGIAEATMDGPQRMATLNEF